MFTGIVQEVGRISHIKPHQTGAEIKILAPEAVSQLQIGDSVATAGVCLTCTTIDDHHFTADLSRETLRLTTLGNLKVGDPVNLELALTLSTRLGGHLVTGHVDGVGTVESVNREGQGKVIVVSAPENVARYIVPKGSIAVDGVSLTVASVTSQQFSVALIPHTLQVTTLGRLKPGDRVNLEADLIGKYVERLLQGYQKDDRIKRLLGEAGFLS